MNKSTHLLSAIAAITIVIATNSVLAAEISEALPAALHETQPTISTTEAIANYKPRFGRTKPVIAIVGENRGTETTDFITPFAILGQSGVADVVTVAAHEGPIQMMPALKISPDATVSAFDARYPDGADYVIVPAVRHADDTVLLGWIAEQARHGATVVGICDGVFVLGNAGLLKGHRATGHWASRKYREKHFKDTQWLTNIRYVADGTVITTAGITASIPTSLALVEAIAGHELAATVAKEIGVGGWTTEHNSDAFKLTARQIYVGLSNYLKFWSQPPLHPSNILPHASHPGRSFPSPNGLPVCVQRVGRPEIERALELRLEMRAGSPDVPGLVHRAGRAGPKIFR